MSTRFIDFSSFYMIYRITTNKIDFDFLSFYKKNDNTNLLKTLQIFTENSFIYVRERLLRFINARKKRKEKKLTHNNNVCFVQVIYRSRYFEFTQIISVCLLLNIFPFLFIF